VRRAGPALLLALCALAGALLAVVLASPTPASTGTTGTTGTTTTATTGTTTTATTTTTTTTAPAAVIADGVTIAGVDVGGLSPESAHDLVRTSVESPLVLVFRKTTLEPTPASLGATFYVQGAVDRARRSAPGTEVELVVSVRGDKVRAYVAKVAKRFDRRAIDSQLLLRGVRPYVTPGRAGRSLDRIAATRDIVRSLTENDRSAIRLVARPVKQRVTRGSFGPVVVIRRGSNRLHLYRGMRPWRTFGVATGQSQYPTPLGRWRIVVKWKNPWWYPPDSEWAKDEEPIPPGPGNPLGTRWMGLSAPAVGIHGTPDAASIGYSASHGCIRMQISDAEWLFERVSIGTTVFIVRA
jgi:lipoprotein-anchoring transpeptidase ErfK/SrfK